MEKIRKRFVFHGSVQGVGFRYKACYSAKNRGVSGCVRNLADGSVEMEAEGYPADIEAVVRALEEHSWGNVESVDEEIIPLVGEYNFEIH
ncbi:MAG TPA: acylphosphatase [Ruminococcaceae bacterium]|nr:acylphosphatase [Oscillospiraceae bacterium]